MIQVMQIEYKVFPYPKGDSIPYDIGNSIPAVQVQDETMKRNKDMKQVESKYGKENVKWIPRSRKHRYVYFNANKRRRKELIQKLNYEILPYPKGNIKAIKTVKQGEPTMAERQISLYELEKITEE